MTTTGLFIVPRTCPGCGQERAYIGLCCTPCEDACDHDYEVVEDMELFVEKECSKCHHSFLEIKRRR